MVTDSRIVDEMILENARELLLDFFNTHEGVKISDAYRLCVDNPSKERSVCHWAFYEVIQEFEEKGIIKKEPIYTVTDHKIRINK